jgi:hypothetical protein
VCWLCGLNNSQNLMCKVPSCLMSLINFFAAFRSLDERNSNDAMDELYDYLWDVTLLEYIVSMHAKRGEFSRKRRALDIITQVSKSRSILHWVQNVCLFYAERNFVFRYLKNSHAGAKFSAEFCICLSVLCSNFVFRYLKNE